MIFVPKATSGKLSTGHYVWQEKKVSEIQPHPLHEGIFI
jgi:hypothetical protein